MLVPTDGDCKGSGSGSYLSNLHWVSVGGTGSVWSISEFGDVVVPAGMGAALLSHVFLRGGVYFLGGKYGGDDNVFIAVGGKVPKM